MHMIFSLLTQRPKLLRSITAFLLPVIDLIVNPSERCFPGKNIPPEHVCITSEADKSTKHSLQADELDKIPPYKVIKTSFRKSGSSTSPATTFCRFRGTF